MKARLVTTKSARGQALVEFVFVLPLLLVLMIGVMQTGILFNNWVILTEAVRQGSRELSIARGPLPHANACTLSTNRINSAAVGLTSASITKVYTLTDSGATMTSTNCTNLTPALNVTVRATYPCNLTILGVNYAPSCAINAVTTIRVE